MNLYLVIYKGLGDNYRVFVVESDSQTKLELVMPEVDPESKYWLSSITLLNGGLERLQKGLPVEVFYS